MLREYLAAEWLDLTVEIELETRPFQTKVQSPDAGEE